MKVTYIGHSGFLVETQHAQLLFDCVAREDNSEPIDYSSGTWPEFDKSKDLLVFESHSHRDHYIHEVWDLRKNHPHVTYILAREIPFSSGVRERLGISEEEAQKVLRVKGKAEYEVTLSTGESVKIETFSSTDEGVAYFVTCEGKTIFHAGDLNAWYWEEETEQYITLMKKMFEKQMMRMEGKKADVAFLPMDNRLGSHTFDGVDRFLETLDITYAFPMHFWKAYDLLRQYKESRKERPFAKSIMLISKENETFELD